jgi:hypothetical protein
VPDARSRDDAPLTLVTDGVESAVAQAAAVAGDGIVGVSAPTSSACLNASLLDEIVINPAVPRGEGIRAAVRGTPLRGDMDRSLLFGIACEWLIGGVALQT